MHHIEVVAALQEELGCQLDPKSVDVIPDPWVDDTFALRLCRPGTDPEYFLLTPEGVEQVEADCWPPKLL